VLVAEDDDAFRRLVASSLEADGFEVWQARDGDELLGEIESVLAHAPDGADSCIVVVDMNMPGLGGLDVLAVLRCASVSTPSS
jgi:two-component system KDP operon response regulator KdpE